MNTKGMPTKTGHLVQDNWKGEKQQKSLMVRRGRQFLLCMGAEGERKRRWSQGRWGGTSYNTPNTHKSISKHSVETSCVSELHAGMVQACKFPLAFAVWYMTHAVPSAWQKCQ